MIKNTNDNTALFVSTGSALLSIASFLFSIYVFNQGRAEVLSADMSLSSGSDPLRCISFGSNNLIIQAPARLIVSNNSDRKISLVTYRVFQSLGSDRRSYYSHIDSGLFNSARKRVELPISIEAGDSKRMEILLGVWADQKAAAEIRKSSLCTKPFTKKALMELLGGKGLDIHGNTVRIEKKGTGLIFYGPGQDAKQQEFEIVLTTGRGSRFYASTSWYPFNESLRPTF
jgi:hypothetical protein